MPSDPAIHLEEFLPYRLNKLAAAVSRDLSRVYRERYGLTIPEWRVLATLGQFGAATATAIGRHSAMHKTKVSRAVQSLTDRRWVARKADSHDRRVEHLSLTAAGRSAYGRLAPEMLDFEHALLARLAAGDRRALMRGLDALEQAAFDTMTRKRGRT